MGPIFGFDMRARARTTHAEYETVSQEAERGIAALEQMLADETVTVESEELALVA